MEEVELSRLKLLDKEQRHRLSSFGIESAEQLLSRCNDPSRVKAMAALLKLDRVRIQAVLDQARKLVSPAFLEELAQPVKRHKRGALVPPGGRGQLATK